MRQLESFVGDLLFEKECAELSIEGNSMKPLYKHGDKVVITQLPRRLYPGMCCVYINTNQLIIHRVLFCIAAFVFTAGDSCFSIEKVPRNALIGTPTIPTPIISRILICLITYIFLPFYYVSPIFKLRPRCIHFLLKGIYHDEKSV